MLVQSVGPALVLLFALSQAFRDVYFADIFQATDFFTVILIAFTISASVFCVVTMVRDRRGFAGLRREWRTVAGMNLTTATAWMCYFFSLTHLQPSIVNTLHSGAGPLTVLALSGAGISIAGPSRTGRTERLCYAGLAASLGFLWWVVLSGRSGLAVEDWRTDFAALGLLIVSGSSITVSLLLAKRLNDRGIGANAVTAGRYVLTIAIAAAVTLSGRGVSGIASLPQFEILVVASTALIVLPLYSLQLGIARTPPLTAHVIRSLGPVFVFALELFDGRIGYSTSTLVGISLYSLFSIAANTARATGRPREQRLMPLYSGRPDVSAAPR